MQRSRCIAHPASIETHIDDRLLHFRQAPAVAIVEQETPLGTERVLTEITLGAAGRFAAFDDLVTLTVRAADGDERHGPFLPMRSYEDEAQCDIYLSPSPLLKHYRRGAVNARRHRTHAHDQETTTGGRRGKRGPHCGRTVLLPGRLISSVDRGNCPFTTP